jgi:hypothetical protein
MTYRLPVLAVLLAAVAAAALACGEGSRGTAPPPVDQGSPVPTSTPGASPTPRDPTPYTGIEGVDIFIDAMQLEPARTRREVLTTLVRYSPTACIVIANEPNKPLCREGESPDQPLDMFEFDNCGRAYLRPHEILQALILIAGAQLYAVYPAPEGTEYSTDHIAIVFHRVGDDDQASAVLLSEGKIVAYRYSCTTTPEPYIEALGLGDPVLAPGALEDGQPTG